MGGIGNRAVNFNLKQPGKSLFPTVWGGTMYTPASYTWSNNHEVDQNNYGECQHQCIDKDTIEITDVGVTTTELYDIIQVVEWYILRGGVSYKIASFGSWAAGIPVGTAAGVTGRRETGEFAWYLQGSNVGYETDGKVRLRCGDTLYCLSTTAGGGTTGMCMPFALLEYENVDRFR